MSRRLALVVVPILLLSAAGIAAMALTPVLLRDAPLALLVLEARNRYLLLVAERVDLVPFVVVGVLRRLASDPFYYLLGRWYGDDAVRWAAAGRGEEHLRRFRSAVEHPWFARLADVAVVLFPGAVVCTLAGAAGMSPRRFAALDVAGSIAVVVALRWLAGVAAEPIAAVVAFNDANAGWLTAVFVAATAAVLLLQRRRPGTGPRLRDIERRD